MVAYTSHHRKPGLALPSRAFTFPATQETAILRLRRTRTLRLAWQSTCQTCASQRLQAIAEFDFFQHDA
jgi:hypothetical protein